MAKQAQNTRKATRQAVSISSTYLPLPVANLITVKNKLTTYFLTGAGAAPNVRPLVTGVGIGVAPPEPGTPPNALPASPSIVIFVEPLPDCELQTIWHQAKKISKTQPFVLLRSGRFQGQASPGDSIGPYAPLQYNVPPVSAGTFGAVVEAAGTSYVLSCNHVMTYNGRAPQGTAVVAPGTLDDPHGSVIGSVSYFVELQPVAWPINQSPANSVDCALAELTQTVVPSLAVSTLGVAAPVPGVPTPVEKTGRTTGTTKGTLCIWDCDLLIDMSFGTFLFTGLMGVVGKGPGPFAAPGDSGSLVKAKSRNQWMASGLVMARAYSSGPFAPPRVKKPQGFVGYIVLMCPITAVQAALAPQLGVQPADIIIKT